MERTNFDNSPTANIKRKEDVIRRNLVSGRSSRIDDEVVQDQRQQDDNDLQDERQDQPKEEEVEPKRRKSGNFLGMAQWNEAIKSEIDSILQNHTCELVDKLLGCKSLGYKWIFKKKTKTDGTINKYKAKLAIKGFRQQEGIYHFDSYSTQITTVKMILAITALRNGEVHQMDMKMTFLNEDLEKVLYMNQPEGFMASGLARKTPMNPDVGKFNSLVNETKAMSEENDENLMTRIEILRNRNRVTNEKLELFGDDALPRPPGMHRIAKSQCSSNSTASFESNPAMFQEMMQQQLEIERKEKIERIDREVNSRVALNDSKRVAEDLKVLQISTDGMDPIDAAIVNAQKARIRALYHPNN
nr:zinc finger CCCH domain-containing protein 14 [Tanacetum cinerariifolium]